MSAWALKLGSALTTLLVLVGSYAYASTNVKNPNAPLQPPVAKSGEATPAPTPIPPLIGARRGTQPGATSSPAPRLTLRPGVYATDLPEVTFTHTS